MRFSVAKVGFALTFRDYVSFPSSRVKMSNKTLEDGNDAQSRNVVSKPIYAA